jgi:hypothetical protein
MLKRIKHGSRADKRVLVDDQPKHTRVIRTPLEDTLPDLDVGMHLLYAMQDPMEWAPQFKWDLKPSKYNHVIAHTEDEALRLYCTEGTDWSRHIHRLQVREGDIRMVPVGHHGLDAEWDFYARSLLSAYRLWQAPDPDHVAWFEHRHPELYHLVTTFDFSNHMDPSACVEEWGWFVGKVTEYLFG